MPQVEMMRPKRAQTVDRTPEAEAILEAIGRELAMKPPEGMTVADVQAWLDRRRDYWTAALASRLPEPTLICEVCGFRASRAIPHYALQRIACPSLGKQFVEFTAYKAQREEQDRQFAERLKDVPAPTYKPSPEALESQRKEREERELKKRARAGRTTSGRPAMPYEPYLSVMDRAGLAARQEYHAAMAAWHEHANLGRYNRRKVEATAAARHKAAAAAFELAVAEWDRVGGVGDAMTRAAVKAAKRRGEAADNATYASDKGSKKAAPIVLPMGAAKSGYAITEGGRHHRPLWFASGSSRVPDIEGWASIGAPIGVSARELTADSEAAIIGLRGKRLPVFVDSGAFSETDDRPLTRDDWQKIIDRQTRIATALGEYAYIVAPDRVGDQELTKERLREWAEPLRAMRATGAHVLVAVQRGKLSAMDFYGLVNAILQFEAVPALPSNKAAMTLAEIVAFVKDMRPRRLHLLGIGARNPRLNMILTQIRDHSPDTDVTIDSNRIVAAVGRQGGKVRKLTAAQDEIRDTLLEQCRSGGDEQIGDYTELIGDPSLWLTRFELKQMARDLSPKLIEKWLRDPLVVLAWADDDDADDAERRASVDLQLAVERAWAGWCVKRVRKRARVHGIAQVFAPTPTPTPTRAAPEPGAALGATQAVVSFEGTRYGDAKVVLVTGPWVHWSPPQATTIEGDVGLNVRLTKIYVPGDAERKRPGIYGYVRENWRQPGHGFNVPAGQRWSWKTGTGKPPREWWTLDLVLDNAKPDPALWHAVSLAVAELDPLKRPIIKHQKWTMAAADGEWLNRGGQPWDATTMPSPPPDALPSGTGVPRPPEPLPAYRGGPRQRTPEQQQADTVAWATEWLRAKLVAEDARGYGPERGSDRLLQGMPAPVLTVRSEDDDYIITVAVAYLPERIKHALTQGARERDRHAYVEFADVAAAAQAAQARLRAASRAA